MYLRLLTASFRRAPRRKALALTVLVVGATFATGLSTLAMGVGDQMALEFRAIGANLRVVPVVNTVDSSASPLSVRRPPSVGYLKETDVAQLLEPGFFWRRNLTALTPTYPLDVRAEGRTVRITGGWFGRRVRSGDGTVMVTGIPQVFPTWKVEGGWPREGRDEIALGPILARRLQRKVGDRLEMAYGGRNASATVVGIVTAGGIEDSQALAPLGLIQRLAGRPGEAPEALVSAITTPESRLAEIAQVDPRKLSPQDYDRWYCTNYPSSIALRIQESIPGSLATTIRRTAETEGKLLTRLRGLLIGAVVAAFLTAALGILSTVWMTLIERRHEIGLLRALGAEDSTITVIFLAESVVLGLTGGLLGWALGQALGWGLSVLVFGRSPGLLLATLPIAVAVSLSIAVLATLPAVRSALRWSTIPLLHGR